MRILHPSPTPDGSGWQRGTADAVRDNLDQVEDSAAEAVLLLAGDHIYKMDYRPLLELHYERGADVTMAVHSVSPHDARRYGMVSVGGDGRVDRFVEKPRRADSSMASMGIYVFRKQYLIDLLRGSNDADFGRNVMPRIIGKANAYAYQFQGYWADVGTVQAYYEANLALLAETPALDLYDPEWVIHTVSSDRPGAEIGPQARVENSLIPDGAQVFGTVVRSVLSPGVVVAPGAVVRDSIVLGDSQIAADAQVESCIIDVGVHVGAGAKLGGGNDMTPNQKSPERLNTGLTLVGMQARIPANAEIGRNVAIMPRIAETAFPKDGKLASGATI